jgi:hypothetical protein
MKIISFKGPGKDGGWFGFCPMTIEIFQRELGNTRFLTSFEPVD